MNEEHQQPEAFPQYPHLGDANKITGFSELIVRNNTLYAHSDGKHSLRFLINQDVVDVFIGEMQFDADEASAKLTLMRALKVFRLFGNPDLADGA